MAWITDRENAHSSDCRRSLRIYAQKSGVITFQRGKGKVVPLPAQEASRQSKTQTRKFTPTETHRGQHYEQSDPLQRHGSGCNWVL